MHPKTSLIPKWVISWKIELRIKQSATSEIT
jgi:hypothetical protein